MFLPTLVWFCIGGVVGTLSALLAPVNSFGWRGDVIISVVGAMAGGLLWPMLNVFLGVGLFNAVIGGVVGVSLTLPVMRLARPALLLFLYPA